MRRWLRVAILIISLALCAPAGAAKKDKPPKFKTPTNSSPITLSVDDKLLWVVNPDDDSVSVINTKNNSVLKTIRVGEEPQSVAVDPANTYAYVANTAEATVSVIEILNAKPKKFKAKVAKDLGENGEFPVGAEPWNIVISPDGQRVFVANSSQDTVTVINSEETFKEKKSGKLKQLTPDVIGDVALRGSTCSPDSQFHFQPRGLAVTKDNTKLYVTRFFSFTRPGFTQVDDEGRAGGLCRMNINTDKEKINKYKPAALIGILPQNTGFTVDQNGDGTPDPTSAWPNQLQSVVIRGSQAYLPNIAASPEGPLRFNVDTEAFVSAVQGVTGNSASDGGFINLHLGARTPEAGEKKLFFANPWAIDFTSQKGTGAAYVASAGSDLLVKLNMDANGGLTFTGGEQTTRYIDLNDPANPVTAGDGAGKNPRGIVINNDGNRAYVMNFVSRNVSVVDLTNDTVIDTIRTSALPPPGSAEEIVQVGAEMFFSSRGHFDRPGNAGSVSTEERLSSEGWQSCASCHFDGLTDGVVWAFGAGPRKSVPLNATFNPNNPTEQRVLNYSAIFDEVEDFELNIRNVSGPGGITPGPCQTPPPGDSAFDPNHGLLIGDNGNINDRPCVVNAFAKANAGRPQHTVTLPGSSVAVPALTALKEWVRLGVRTPDAPIPGIEGGATTADINAGRTLFQNQGCASCHGTQLWTSSIKNFTSPPAAGEIFTETNPAPVTGNPIGAQYLNVFLRDINSFNIGVPGQGNDLGNNIGGVEKASAALNAMGVAGAAPDGLGRDYNADGRGIGFSPGSLLGLNASQPYYHNGACETFDCVLSDVQHRTGKGARPDLLTSSADRAKVAAFLESIDQTTPPVP